MRRPRFYFPLGVEETTLGSEKYYGPRMCVCTQAGVVEDELPRPYLSLCVLLCCFLFCFFNDLGTVRCGTVRYGMVRYVKVRCGT